MPILARETDIFPDHILTNPELLAPDAQWWAVYTISRREKQLMRYLVDAEIPCFTPFIAKRNRSSGGRLRTSHIPLFSNYVFMYATPAQRYESKKSNCVSQMIEVVDGEELREDLLQVRNLIDAGVPLTVESRIQSGQRVRVRTGHFAGFEGTVLKRHSNIRLLIVVQFIQQGVSLLLDDCQLELI